MTHPCHWARPGPATNTRPRGRPLTQTAHVARAGTRAGPAAYPEAVPPPGPGQSTPPTRNGPTL
jgi:hypothetical protein